MSERQPEVDDRHDSLVVEGDDSEHVLPPSELDPYTPEPRPRRRPQLALWLAIAVLVVVIVIVLYAALT